MQSKKSDRIETCIVAPFPSRYLKFLGSERSLVALQITSVVAGSNPAYPESYLKIGGDWSYGILDGLGAVPDGELVYQLPTKQVDEHKNVPVELLPNFGGF